MDHDRVLLGLDDILDPAECLLQELGGIRIGRTDQTRERAGGGDVRDQAHLVHSAARHTDWNLEVEPIPVPIGLGQQGVVETYPEKYAVPILVSARPPDIAKAQENGLIAMRTKWIMFSKVGFVPQERFNVEKGKEVAVVIKGIVSPDGAVVGLSESTTGWVELSDPEQVTRMIYEARRARSRQPAEL